MQAELTAWAKRRFSVLAIVVAVVGTFGFTTLLTQIIQALVSSNVQSSVEKEIAGLKDAINREILYARNTVDRELSKIDRNFDRAVLRLDGSIERAAKKEASLYHATNAAQNAAAEVQVGLRSALQQVEQASSEIHLVDQEAQRLRQDYQNLTENYGKSGEDLSAHVYKAEALVARNKKELDGIEERIRDMRRLYHSRSALWVKAIKMLTLSFRPLRTLKRSSWPSMQTAP